MHTMTEAGQDATADAIDIDDLVASDPYPSVPELDPEAALLCALLHTTEHAQVHHVTTHLEATDFLNPRYADLFAVVAELVEAGEPHHATRVLAALRGAGRLGGHQGKLITDALQTVALLGTPAVGLTALAADVLDSAYRRRYVAAVQALVRNATEAPTELLMELMVEQGCNVREQDNRRRAFAGR